MNKRSIIWFACFSAIGVLYQSIFLAAFMFVARTDFANEGKPLVVGAALFIAALMVWVWIRSMQVSLWLILAPAALAVGFSVAYQLVGVLFFPGRLGDFYPPFLDYPSTGLRVTANVFVLYGIATGLLVFLNRLMTRRCQPKWLNSESIALEGSEPQAIQLTSDSVQPIVSRGEAKPAR